jgi:integrase/recombinase XerD
MPSKAKRKEIMNAKRGRWKLQVLTPTEVQMFLTYCEREEPTLTPYACLCVWGGLRPEREAPNMIDDDITTESVTVPEEFAKDNETRIIEPLLDNFIEWIEFIKGREGSFQPVKNLKRKWEKAKKSIGREWPHDCLRHSYASYHFTEFNDAGLTAKNLGHPDSMLLRKDYNGAVTKAQAKEFWAIRPSDCC